MNPKIDEYLSKADKWQEELEQMRRIALDCMLTEELKWGVPCYTFQKSNVVLFHAFKEYCAFSFFKGALLSDSESILIKPGENSQAGRQLRFKSVGEIVALESTIKAYIFEAIEVEKAGLDIVYKETTDYEVPQELIGKFNEMPQLKVAFEALTPGRQRGYILHFSGAKQPKTRLSRIEQCIPRILMGKGFTDCICGHSKRMPGCDGSHKWI